MLVGADAGFHLLDFIYKHELKEHKEHKRQKGQNTRET